MWIFYELPHLGSSVFHASFYACTVDGACHGPEPWGVSWLTSIFMHGSWDHILGNMLFLAIFGKNVEDAFGHLRYLAFYLAGGFVATMTQTAMTLWPGRPPTPACRRSAPAARSPPCLAPTSCSIRSRVLTLVFVFLVRIPAYVFIGIWFLFQLVEGNFGLFSAHANGGGTAFFAHVGGFLFGVLVVRLLAGASLRAMPDTA